MLELLLRHLAVEIGDDDAGGGDEDGHGLVQRVVAYLQQDLDQFVHSFIQLLLAPGVGKQVDGLDADGVDGVVVLTHAASLEEVIQVLAVVGQEIFDADLHLFEIQAGRHLEERGDASVQVPAGEVAVAVGDQFGQVVVQVDLELQGDGRRGVLRRIDEVDEALERGVQVDQMPQLVADDESQFILAHQVEQLGVDVYDMGVLRVFRCDGKGVDG